MRDIIFDVLFFVDSYLKGYTYVQMHACKKQNLSLSLGREGIRGGGVS